MLWSSKQVALTAVIALAGLTGCSLDDAARSRGAGFPSGSPRGTDPPENAERTRVERVVDGDTVELRGLGSSRLIGVDTPEVHESVECFGPEASEFTQRTLESASRVRVLLGTEPHDRYGRDLVYLWLPDGRLFNALLIQRGYATPLTIPPNDALADRFERDADVASVRSRGWWGEC